MQGITREHPAVPVFAVGIFAALSLFGLAAQFPVQRSKFLRHSGFSEPSLPVLPQGRNYMLNEQLTCAVPLNCIEHTGTAGLTGKRGKFAGLLF